MENRQSSAPEYPHHELTRAIIGCAFSVHRAFGFGFLESVYRRALLAELRFAGLAVEAERSFRLTHRGTDVGVYRADIVVDSRVIVEVKTGLHLDPAAIAQLLNYLKASQAEVGVVLHFGLSVEIKRLVLSTALRGVIDPQSE